MATVTGAGPRVADGRTDALNLLGHLAASRPPTAALVAAVEGRKARITCTRKTTPGLRALEKYAVRVGGGVNHRFGLDDAVLIKDNHVAACGRRAQADRARPGSGRPSGQDRGRGRHPGPARRGAGGWASTRSCSTTCRPTTCARPSRMVAGRVITEASGGITPATVRPSRRPAST